MGSVKSYNNGTLMKLTPKPARLGGIIAGVNPDEAVTMAQFNALQDGTVDVSRVELAESGTAAAPVITWDGDTDTGLYRIGANNIGFSANGAKVLDIATTGLAVTGTLSATTTVTATTLFFSGDGAVGAPTYSFVSDTDSGVYRIGANNIGVAVNGAKVLDVATTGLTVTGALSSTTTLAAGTSFNVGTDQTFTKEVNHTVSVSAATTAATVGGSLTINSGDGATSGNGGALTVTPGTGGTTGTGGALNLTSGLGGSASGNSGVVNIRSGNETGTDLSGNVNVTTGTTASANSGDLTVRTGAVATLGNSGAYSAGSGVSTTSGDSGTVTVSSGNATAGTSGNLIFASGTGTTSSGSVTISSGNASAGTAGNIVFTPGTTSSATVSPIVVATSNLAVKPLNTASVATGAAITGKQLVDGYIAITGGTGNVQLPDTADVTTALGASPAGTVLEFTVNAVGMTATNTATFVVGANMTVPSAPVITGGGTLTLTQDTQEIGVFKLVFITATTTKLFRIA